MLRRSIFLLLLLLLFTGCTISQVDVHQEQASGLASELVDGQVYGQTFTLKNDGLYRIDLYTATYGRENNFPVIFRIKSSPSSVEDLFTKKIPANQVSNSGPTILTFQPLEQVRGMQLYLSIESPGSVAGDAITVYQNERDVYPGGQMYLNGQATGGDLAFIAYTQNHFTYVDVINDFSARLNQDRAFSTFYFSLLGLVIIGMIALHIFNKR